MSVPSAACKPPIPPILPATVLTNGDHTAIQNMTNGQVNEGPHPIRNGQYYHFCNDPACNYRKFDFAIPRTLKLSSEDCKPSLYQCINSVKSGHGNRTLPHRYKYNESCETSTSQLINGATSTRATDVMRHEITPKLDVEGISECDVYQNPKELASILERLYSRRDQLIRYLMAAERDLFKMTWHEMMITGVRPVINEDGSSQQSLSDISNRSTKLFGDVQLQAERLLNRLKLRKSGRSKSAHARVPESESLERTPFQYRALVDSNLHETYNKSGGDQQQTMQSPAIPQRILRWWRQNRRRSMIDTKRRQSLGIFEAAKSVDSPPVQSGVCRNGILRTRGSSMPPSEQPPPCPPELYPRNDARRTSFKLYQHAAIGEPEKMNDDVVIDLATPSKSCAGGYTFVKNSFPKRPTRGYSNEVTMYMENPPNGKPIALKLIPCHPHMMEATTDGFLPTNGDPDRHSSEEPTQAEQSHSTHELPSVMRRHRSRDKFQWTTVSGEVTKYQPSRTQVINQPITSQISSHQPICTCTSDHRARFNRMRKYSIPNETGMGRPTHYRETSPRWVTTQHPVCNREGTRPLPAACFKLLPHIHSVADRISYCPHVNDIVDVSRTKDSITKEQLFQSRHAPVRVRNEYELISIVPPNGPSEHYYSSKANDQVRVKNIHYQPSVTRHNMWTNAHRCINIGSQLADARVQQLRHIPPRPHSDSHARGNPSESLPSHSRGYYICPEAPYNTYRLPVIQDSKRIPSGSLDRWEMRVNSRTSAPKQTGQIYTKKHAMINPAQISQDAKLIRRLNHWNSTHNDSIHKHCPATASGQSVQHSNGPVCLTTGSNKPISTVYLLDPNSFR